MEAEKLTGRGDDGPVSDHTNFLSLGSAVAVGLVILYVSSLTTTLLTATTAGLIAFSLCRYVMGTHEDTPLVFHDEKTGGQTPPLRRELAVLLTYCLAIGGLLVLPGETTRFETGWASISALSWFRLSLAILLTMYLPGYGILRLVDKENQIRGTPGVLLSYVSSMGFTVLASIPFLGSPLASKALISLNLVGVIFLVARILRRRHLSDGYSGALRSKPPASLHSTTMLVGCVLGFVAVEVLSIFLLAPWPRGDIWRHLADATYVSKYGLASRGYYYPWFNSVLWSQVLTVSSFPAMNAIMIAVSLVYLASVPTFFAGIKSLTKNQSVAAISTLFWAAFAGFDWLATPKFHDLSSLQSTALKYESGIFYPPGFFGFDHPLFLVGIMCLLIVLSLFAETNLAPRVRLFFLGLVFYVGYAVNVEVMTIFLIAFLPVMALLRRSDSLAISSGTIGALVCGLGLVGLTDLLSGAAVRFYLDGTYLLPLLLYLSALSAALLKSSWAQKKTNRLGSVRIGSREKWIATQVLYYGYLLSFLVLPYALPTLPIRPFFTNVPAYQYPFRLGIVGILAVVLPLTTLRPGEGHFFLSRTRLLVSILLAILLEAEVAGWLGVFDQARFFYPAFILISVLAAWSLLRLCKELGRNVHGKKSPLRRVGITILVTWVLISGISSTVLSVNFWASAAGPWGGLLFPSAEERAALESLWTIPTQGHFTVASPSRFWNSYDNQLLGLSGVRTLYDDQLNLFFGTRNPVTTFIVQDLQGIRYLWISRSRIDPVYNSSYVMSHLAGNLTPIFDGSDIQIFSLPTFYPPSGRSLGVVPAGGYVSRSEYYVAEMIGMSGLEYQVLSGSDYSQLGYSTLLFTSDTFSKGWLDFNFTEWTPNFGTATSFGQGATYRTPNDSSPYYDYVSPDLNINASDGRYLVLNWRMPSYGRGQAGLTLILHGSTSGLHFIDLGYSDTWVTTRVDLRDFRSFMASTSRSPLEHDAINPGEEIDRVIFRTGDKNATYQLRSIGLVNTPFVPSFNPVDWVSRGNRLVVVDTYGYGYFAQLLGLRGGLGSNVFADELRSGDVAISIPKVELPTQNRSIDGSVLASYSLDGQIVAPLASAKALGRGEIIYLDLLPYLQALAQVGSRNEKHQLFLALKDLPRLLNIAKEDRHRVDGEIPPIGYVETKNHAAFSHASLTGSILINTTFLELASDQQFDSLTVDPDSGNGMPNLSFLRKVTVNGTSDISLGAAHASLIPAEDLGSYSLLYFESGVNVRIQTYGAMINLILMSDPTGSTSLNITTKTASITYSKPIFVRVRQPSIAIKGTMHLEGAWFDVLGDRNILARNQNVDLAGDMKLNIDSMTPIVMSAKLSSMKQVNAHFLSSGVFTSGSLYKSFYLYSVVPWQKILTSPWNLILITVFAVTAVRNSRPRAGAFRRLLGKVKRPNLHT